MGELSHNPVVAAKNTGSKNVTRSTPKNARVIEGSVSQGGQNVPEDAPAQNTRSKSSQNGSQDKAQIQKPSLRAKNILKPIPSDTQESLIFPKRRPKGRVYTAPTKTTMVDWDEDLRASDASVEPASQKENELTSVSSPSSNGPGFNLNQSSKKRRPGSTRKKPLAKTKAQTKTGGRRSKAIRPGQKRLKKQVKLLSPPLLRSIERHDREIHPPTDVSGRKVELSSKASKLESDSGFPEQQNAANVASPSQAPAESKSNQEHKSSEPQEDNSPIGLSTVEASSNGDQDLGISHQGRGQTVAEKLIAALRGSITPRHGLDGSLKNQLNDKTCRVDEIPESPELQDELGRNDAQPDLFAPSRPRSVLDSWASNMSQEETMVDEMYPVEIYPINSPGGSRVSSLQGREADPDWILGTQDLVKQMENAGESTRIWRASSSASSSSAEPRSTASTFEYFFTRQSPLKGHNATPINQMSAESIVDHDRLVVQKTSGRIDTTNDIEAAKLAITALDERAENDAGRVAQSSEPSPKITVDKNGSPQMMRQANRTNREHVTLPPKRRVASLAVEQPPTAKRTKLLDQDEPRSVISHALEKIHAGKTASQAVDGSRVASNAGISEVSKRHPFGQHVRMMEELSTHFSASDTITTGKEKSVPFLNRLRTTVNGRHSSEASKPSSASTTREEDQTSNDHDLAPEAQRSSAGNLSNKQASSEQETDWQTSMQELHRSMERTLLENNEHLSRQIESERSAVNRVLNVYREQCHTVLNQLFDAQTERIKLCKQQMESIKQQHSIVCQGLIRRLEENEQSLGAVGES
ncbi:uncharacterized protein BDV17DRAFT_262073 [Aspergillus undulatus]|uniref:uncharacterized protein n=1 Tax=Aspergillus undulatus TaxID=1810928 RepID=UPI003CCE3329